MNEKALPFKKNVLVTFAYKVNVASLVKFLTQKERHYGVFCEKNKTKQKQRQTVKQYAAVCSVDSTFISKRHYSYPKIIAFIEFEPNK